MPSHDGPRPMTERADRSLAASGPAEPTCPPLPDGGTTLAPIADEQVGLWVNGRHFEIVVDPRTTLLDALREHLGLTGASPAAIRALVAPAPCTWTIGGSSPASSLPSPPTDSRSRQSKAWPGRTTRSIPCSRRSWTTTRFNVGIARPVRSCRQSDASRKGTPTPTRKYENT